ncbi:9989_t:CDS:2 [Entrophospora sp. SA101]|nr:9989_t:CDS:2 [Entrophospora sp. SA101]
MKDAIAQQLKQEFAQGNFKPSQLKRSKSTGDIPLTPPLPNIPLKKSASQPETPQTLSPEQEISQLQSQIKFHAQTSQNYLQSLQAAQAKITELEEELQAKETFVDATEKNPAELKTKISQLEQQILELRLKSLKDFGEYYEEKQALKGELEENIQEGVQEIRRLENKLLALNKKKLIIQSQLQQAELKNTRLELKAIDRQPKTSEDLCSACLQRELGERIPPSRKQVTFPLDDEADFEEDKGMSQKEQLILIKKEFKIQLTEEQNKAHETKLLLEQKIQDLETQLFNLAKQKLKGKKETQELKQEITQHLARIQELETQLTSKTTELTQELAKTQQLQQTKETNEKALQEKQKELAELQKTLTASQTSMANLRQEIAELKKASVSKKELEAEQKKLQINKEVLQKQITENRKQEQTIQGLEKNLAKSEEVLKETSEQLAHAQQESAELAQQKEQLQKDLTQSLQQLAQAQENQSLLEQKITDLETSLFNLAKQKLKGKKEASELVAQLETNCQEHQETLTRKSKELSKLRLEVVSLQGQLKAKEKPKPDKFPAKTEPINP